MKIRKATMALGTLVLASGTSIGFAGSASAAPASFVDRRQLRRRQR